MPTPSIVFGLISALAWGTGDFGGGLAARRGNLFHAVAASQGAGVLLMVALAVLRGESVPAAVSLAWAAGAGLLGGAGIAALYRALAVGTMGIAAPVSAVLAGAVAATFGVVAQGSPGARLVIVFGAAMVG
ncbi:MAG: EamA family transporter, partial [Armatimonadetes bacterium]|nr:EamA family transporter [Armatimonadota bacterium]